MRVVRAEGARVFAFASAAVSHAPAAALGAIAPIHCATEDFTGRPQDFGDSRKLRYNTEFSPSSRFYFY